MKKLCSIVVLICTFITILPSALTAAEVHTKTVFIDCAMDAHVRNGNLACYNYGGADSIRLSSSEDGEITSKGYIKFYLNEIGADNIKSATLRLCSSDNNNYATNALGICDANAWIEGDGNGDILNNGEITWNNAPKMNEHISLIPKGTTKREPVFIDLTNIVKKYYAEEITFVIYPGEAKKYPAGYYTKESGETGKTPQLIVELYDYDRKLAKIDLSGNSYIQKTTYNDASLNLECECYDQYGQQMDISSVSIDLKDDVSGVQLKNGVLHIDKDVEADSVVIVAKAEGINCEQTICLIDEGDARSVDLSSADERRKHHAEVYQANYGSECISLNKDGYVLFDISISPIAQNYITVELGGSDNGSGMLFLDTPDSEINGSYGTSTPELDRIMNVPIFETGNSYSTYALPEELTAGRNKIRLKIFSTGQANPYSSGDKTGKQTEPSRRIFGITSHTDPTMINRSNEASVALPGTVVTNKIAQKEYIRNYLDESIQKLLNWQVYGDKFERFCANYPELRLFEGMLPFKGVSLNLTTKQEWKDTNYKRTFTSNLATMNSLYLFAIAYKSEWSNYYQKEEMIDRILKAMDFLCVAQGANGGFQSAGGNWVGGPERINANGSALEGYGQIGFAQGFCEIFDFLSSDDLNYEIDDDDNLNTTDVSRKDAYLRLFKMSREHIGVGSGHAPNQDAANKLAVLYINKAIELLDKDSAWTEKEVNKYVDIVLGEAVNSINYNYWVSDKGIPMEPGEIGRAHV